METQRYTEVTASKVVCPNESSSDQRGYFSSNKKDQEGKN